MKFLTGSILFAAAVVAVPSPVAKRAEIAGRTPIAEAFASNFRTFVGRSEEDVARFVSKGEQITKDTQEDALKWKRNVEDADDETSNAIAVAKRSLFIRRESAKKADFWVQENEKADAIAQHSRKLKRKAQVAREAANQANDIFTATVLQRVSRDSAVTDADVWEAHTAAHEASVLADNIRRETEDAMSDATEAYALVAYALRIQESSESVDAFVARDETTVEGAMTKERQAKRELFFATNAARKREAIHERTLKLRDDYL